jgi:hypothetical protein
MTTCTWKKQLYREGVGVFMKIEHIQLKDVFKNVLCLRSSVTGYSVWLRGFILKSTFCTICCLFTLFNVMLYLYNPKFGRMASRI